MIVIIAGSRDITEMSYLEEAIKASNYEITEIISGGARGVDSLGEEYAIIHRIPFRVFPVHDFEWKKDRGAGYRRNERMAKEGEALIAVWDGVSGGTAHMIKMADKYGLLKYIHRVPPEKPAVTHRSR